MSFKGPGNIMRTQPTNRYASEPAQPVLAKFGVDGKLLPEFIPSVALDDAMVFSDMEEATGTDFASFGGKVAIIGGARGGVFFVDAAAEGTADGVTIIDVNGGAQQLVRFTEPAVTRAKFYELPESPLITIEKFDRLSDWTLIGAGANALIQDSTNPHQIGRGSFNFVTAAGAGSQEYITQNRQIDLSWVDGFWLIVRINSRPVGGNGLLVYLSQSENLASGVGRLLSSAYPLSSYVGRQSVWIKKSAMATIDGSPDLSNPILSWRFRIDSVDSVVRDWDLDGVVLGKSRPKIVITFDDGYSSSYTAGHIEARKRNIPLTHYLIAAQLNQSGHLTTAQATEIAGSDDYIGLHGAALWSTDTSRIATDKAALLATGLSDCKHASYPNGDIGSGYGWAAVEAAVKSAGVLTARMADGGQPFLPRYTNLHAMSAYNLNSNLSLANAKAAVDDAIAAGGTSFFMGHKIDSVADSLTWTNSDWSDFLDYVDLKRSSGAIDVETVESWHAGF